MFLNFRANFFFEFAENTGFRYEFDKSASRSTDVNAVKLDILSFLGTKAEKNEKKLNSLNDHKYVAMIFEKFNCLNTSQTPCERLFSFGGIFHLEVSRTNSKCLKNVFFFYRHDFAATPPATSRFFI